MRKKNIHKDTEPKGSFLRRWSQRKAEGGAELSVAESAIPAQPESDNDPATTTESDRPEESVVVDEESDPVLTDEDMPDISSLDEKSDFSGFMSQGVSDKLRKVALRKLFSSAGFNIRDGLDDYDDDFTNFPALGDLITSDMKHQMEMQEKREQEEKRLAEAEENIEEEHADPDTELDEQQKSAEVADSDPEDPEDPEDQDEHGEVVTHAPGPDIQPDVQDETPEET